MSLACLILTTAAPAFAVLRPADAPPPVESQTWQDAIDRGQWLNAARALALLPDAGSSVAGIHCQEESGSELPPPTEVQSSPPQSAPQPLAATPSTPAKETLPATETFSSPVIEWARATVALQLQAPDAALCSLNGLEEQLPELAPRILEAKRRAQVLSSNYVDYVEALLESRDVALLLDLLERLVEDEHTALGSRAVQALQPLSRPQRQEPRFRWLRAAQGGQMGNRYRTYLDLRWLALSRPETLEGKDAAQRLLELFPDHPFQAKERIQRLQRLADEGDLTGVDAELEALATLRYRMSEAAVLNWKATAAYRARQFGAAAPLYEASFQLTRSLQTLYDAANAYARAGQSESSRGLLQLLSQQKPKSSLTGLGLFKLAREWSYQGQWEEAIGAFSKYLEQYPGGPYVESARAERALGWFAQGRLKRAAHEFLQLSQQQAGRSQGTLYAYLVAESQLRDRDPRLRNHALQVLDGLTEQNPLGFAAWRARIRDVLEQKSLRPLEQGQSLFYPTPSEEPQRPLLPLPDRVLELEQAGLKADADWLMERLGSEWSRDRAASAEEECTGLARLSGGRRRYLRGVDAARRQRLFSAPQAAPRWSWECAYPTPYPDWVAHAADEFDVPFALVYAVMRQESGFRPRVRSPADARGLMQIIPKTGAEIAQQLGLPYSDELLDDPRTNIRFGTFYLSSLLQRFNHDPLLAAAAYNAGPEAAEIWSAQMAELPGELFVLRIPYSETQNYVQRVLANFYTYQNLYPEPSAPGIPESG